MEDAAKDAFLPEFINRIDEIVTFDALDAGAGRADRRADGRPRRRPAARRARDRRSTVDDALRRRAWPRDGFDEAYGARPLQRHIRRTLEKALTRAILAGELADGATVRALDRDGAIALDLVPDQPRLALAA